MMNGEDNNKRLLKVFGREEKLLTLKEFCGDGSILAPGEVQRLLKALEEDEEEKS